MIHEKEQKNLRIYNHDHHNLSLLVLLTKKIEKKINLFLLQIKLYNKICFRC